MIDECVYSGNNNNRKKLTASRDEYFCIPASVAFAPLEMTTATVSRTTIFDSQKRHSDPALL